MKIERSELLKTLGRVKPALATSTKVVELKYFWLDGKFLYAYNGAMGIRVEFPSWDLKPCGVFGATLLGLLESSSAKEVELVPSTLSSAPALDVKLGKSKTTIPVISEAGANPWGFPKAPSGNAWTMSAALIEGMRRARVLKARSPTKVMHYGLTLIANKDETMIYSTDSTTLLEVPVPMKLTKDVSRTVLPFGFVDQLVSMKVGAKLYLSGDALMATDGDLLVCSNLLDRSAVPDISAVVSASLRDKGKPVKLPEGFGEAVNRGWVLAGEDEAVAVSFVKKELVLSGTFVNGNLEERLPLAVVGDGRIKVKLSQLVLLKGDAEEVCISPKALIFYGKNESLALVASYMETK